MTNEQVLSLLKELRLNISNISDIHWKTQDSKEESLLFYKVNNNSEDEITKCKNRLETAKFKACIINTKFNDQFENINNVHLVSNEEFIQLQEYCLNFLYPLRSELKVCSITGTNGKTTTVDIIRQLILLKKKRVMTIGTLGVYINKEQVENFSLTTPAYIDLRKIINKYQDDVDFIAMEVSSHALFQNRIGSLMFDAGGWTNLTQDHLDFHKTMGEYLKAKELIFNHLKKGAFLWLPTNQTDLIEKLTKKPIKVIEPKEVQRNSFFELGYNKENLAVALGVVNGMEPKFLFSQEELEKICAPPGRFNIFESKNQKIIIDYAHTPDGLLSITKEIKNSFKDKKLLTIFGCGGDRDKSKRPLMAIAAEKHSDYVILSTDNPRFENPIDIINDAKKGFEKDSFEIVLDRIEAIRKAMTKFEYEVVLIAGKGNENYIDINGVKAPYSDLEVVLGVIKND